MSTMSKCPPEAFVRHNDLEFPAAGDVEKYHSSAARNASTAPIRSDHIVLWAINLLLILHASLKKWRQRRRTLRALAELDERQLRDIGLTRDDVGPDRALGLLRHRDSYRALGEHDDTPQAD